MCQNLIFHSIGQHSCLMGAFGTLLSKHGHQLELQSLWDIPQLWQALESKTNHRPLIHYPLQKHLPCFSTSFGCMQYILIRYPMKTSMLAVLYAPPPLGRRAIWDKTYSDWLRTMCTIDTKWTHTHTYILKYLCFQLEISALVALTNVVACAFSNAITSELITRKNNWINQLRKIIIINYTILH